MEVLDTTARPGSNNKFTTDNNEPGILSDSEREIFEIVNIVCLSCVISFFGIIGNVINILVFFIQGFANTINISFFGIAISDMCCLITLLWITLCLNPLVVKSGVPWVPTEFEYLTGAWPHIISGRITSYITVYITAERCLCILAPLKVKQMVTPTRTTVIVCIIYIMNLLTLIPEYSTTFLDWKYLPKWNKTLLGISFTTTRQNVAGLTFFLNSVTGMLSFVAVIIFTVILAIKLRQASQWRKEVTSASDQPGPMSGRDKKILKMIVLIATVLIVCYTPGTIFAMTSFVVPEFDIQKKYVNLGVAMWSLGFVFQAVNSSVNILLYYKMSSKYRQTFGELFGRNQS